MLILLEGADGTGKSTLARALAKELAGKARTLVEVRRGHDYIRKFPDAVQVLSRAQPVRGPFDEYVNALDGYEPGRGHVICDRWHWGELVYGPLYRGESSVNDMILAHIDDALMALGALMVHCDGARTQVHNVLSTRGENYLQPQHLDHVLERYRTLKAATPLDVMTVRALEESSITLARRILTLQMMS